MSRYFYGMRMRPFGPGCQPKGAELVVDFDGKAGKFWSIISYNRLLTDEEVRGYGLEMLGASDE